MNKNTVKQYTLRNIPSSVDQALKRLARETGKSFNQIAIDALVRGSGQSLIPKRDFSFIIGSLSEADAKALEDSICAQNPIDSRLWK